MTYYKFLLNFVKEYDLYGFKELMSYLKTNNYDGNHIIRNFYRASNIINYCCGWTYSSIGRVKCEYLHYKLNVALYEAFVKGQIIDKDETLFSVRELVRSNLNEGFISRSPIELKNEVKTFLRNMPYLTS